MGAAAQFDRPAERVASTLAHGYDAHLVAILLAEQGARPGFARIVHPHHAGDDLAVLQHDVVGDVLDALQFLRRDRLGVREIEAQALRRDQRATLGNVIAEHEAQRLVQQMGRRMVGADRAAPGAIDFELQRQAGLERALLHRAEMDEQIARLLLGVGDAETHALAGQHADIADLAAGFAVKRRLVHHHRAGLAGLQRLDALAVPDQRRHDAFGDFGLVAEEFGRAELLAQRKPDLLRRDVTRAGPCGARLGALLVHRVGEGRDIDADAARAQRILGEVERKAIGVVQRERGLAVEHVAFLEIAALVVEDRQALGQRLAEAGFLQLQRFLDQLLGAHQFRIGLTHLAHQRPDEAIHQGVPGAEQLRMAHGAAHDPAQHVAASLVGRQHAVGDQERRSAQVIGDHTQRGLHRAVRIGAGEFGGGADQRNEQVDLIIVVLALQHRGDALQPHAGVDRGMRQRIAHAARDLLELHEHEIPYLDEAVAVLVRRAGRPAGNLVAVIEEDFRTWTARAGIAHLPEIVRGRDADDPGFRQAGDLLPQVEGLVVLREHGDQKPLLGQREFLGDQVPGELDRAILEVIAEREIAEHLEEGVVARGVADIVEVVMLAAGADALLRGGGALIGAPLKTREHVLELHHARIGEHQGRVVARHQRRGRHLLVAVFREIIQKPRPDLVNAAHNRPIALCSNPPLPMRDHAALFHAAFRRGPRACPQSGIHEADLGSDGCERTTPDRLNSGRVDSPRIPCFASHTTSRRKRPAQPAPKEQPPRKLSGKRTA